MSKFKSGFKITNELKIKLAFSILAVVFVLFNSLFIVSQTEKALILQLGEPVRVVEEPGLKAKVPFLQNVLIFDNRIQDLNADQSEVIAADQKTLKVDAFAKYKILDPLKFYQTVKDERGLKNRLNPILDSSLRQVLGSVEFSSLLTGERSNVMLKIKSVLNSQAQSFGIDIVDVRIKRAELPDTSRQAVFKRMQTEREREAKEIRAQGAEEAQRIIATADKDRTVILAEATKKSQIIKGEGDGAATKIFADAFGRDPEFFRFYRSMEAYRKSINKDDTTIILSPQSDFMKYFN